MDDIIYPCSHCNKNVYSDAIECPICMLWCHRTCAKLSLKKLQVLSDTNEYWYCNKCAVLFPFTTIDDDEFTYIHSDIDGSIEYVSLFKTCKSMQVSRNEYTTHNICDFENKTDPTNNFFADIKSECSYYTATEFNYNVKIKDILSVIHFNCRSLK